MNIHSGSTIRLQPVDLGNSPATLSDLIRPLPGNRHQYESTVSFDFDSARGTPLSSHSVSSPLAVRYGHEHSNGLRCRNSLPTAAISGADGYAG
jgi:hypothetical protein